MTKLRDGESVRGSKIWTKHILKEKLDQRKPTKTAQIHWEWVEKKGLNDQTRS